MVKIFNCPHCYKKFGLFSDFLDGFLLLDKPGSPALPGGGGSLRHFTTLFPYFSRLHIEISSFGLKIMIKIFKNVNTRASEPHFPNFNVPDADLKIDVKNTKNILSLS